MKTQNKYTLLLLAALAAATSAHSAVVASYGPADYVSTSQAFITRSTAASATTHTTNRAYSTVTPLLSPSGSYTGPAIYGGYHHTMTRTADFTQVTNLGVIFQASNDPIRSQSMNTTASGTSSFAMNYAFLFAVTGVENYGFDGTSVLSWRAVSAGGQSGNYAMRFLVVADGNTYLSETSYQWTSTSTTYTLDNPDEINWALWTPAANMSFAGLTYDVSGSDLSNITFVGYATNLSSTAAAQALRTLDTYSYTADLAVIPEGGGADYASWAADNGIDGQPATGDFDNDGLSNLMEYAIDGRNPALPDGPIGSLIDGTVTFNKRAEAVSNGDLSYRIELSTDLGLTDDWTPVTANETLSTISWTFPGSEPSNFARLVVTQAP